VILIQLLSCYLFVFIFHFSLKAFIKEKCVDCDDILVKTTKQNNKTTKEENVMPA
jgi:hypothetical protein